MGRSEQPAAEALVKLIVVHLLKLQFAADGSARGHWRKPVRALRGNFRRRTTSSVTARLRGELDAIYEVARPETIAALWQDPELENRLPLQLGAGHGRVASRLGIPRYTANALRARPLFCVLKIELASGAGGRGRRTGTGLTRGMTVGLPQITRSCRSSQIACWPWRWM